MIDPKVMEGFDLTVKEIKPLLGSDKLPSTHFLVQPMDYLFVRLIKSKDLGRGTYLSVHLGGFEATTLQHCKKNVNLEWNQVFAFSLDQLQIWILKIVVKDKINNHNVLGEVTFDSTTVPRLAIGDTPLAPKWYKLKDCNWEAQIMLSTWMSTQADEAFAEAWHSDSVPLSQYSLRHIRSFEYLGPKLCVLRVSMIECCHLEACRYVRGIIGNQEARTRMLEGEDLVFVVTEPVEEQLILIVEDMEQNPLGSCTISLHEVGRRINDTEPVESRWFAIDEDVDGMIRLSLSLDSDFHVLDESAHYSNDIGPTDEDQKLGLLQVGILSAGDLIPMKTKDGRATTDAYCVAKYGQKWVRTRTVTNSFAPKWNEQYTWDVYDPCTVFTIGVFDNWHLLGADNNTEANDPVIGKVRIRLSTLHTERVYTHSYPLLVLHESGVKKMGEIQLAVKFSSLGTRSMMRRYLQPSLPKLQYVHRLVETESLRHQSIRLISMCLSRSEPPLREEIVDYMLDVDSHFWSMRKTRVNMSRCSLVLQSMFFFYTWVNNVRKWKKPLMAILCHVLFVTLVEYSHLILPTIFSSLLAKALWNYRWRSIDPPHINVEASLPTHNYGIMHHDEIDEEQDSFPSSRSFEVTRTRYDRLRTVAALVQGNLCRLATCGEKLQSLVTWHDPRATLIFLFFCLLAAIFLYFTPIKWVALFSFFYLFRHPKLRTKFPSTPRNFFNRLPSRIDSML